tara:strand:+ start:440 stop:2089 length:1650 start_codon:yes stop_codon:yes gene_type:complete
MANWKKVIVSGSAAKLSALTIDTALPVASGGTGAQSLTDGGVVVGSGTGAVTSLGQATNGQLVVGSTGADPVLATLTGGANITVTNTAGAISIAASGLGSGTVQSVAATGTENGLTLTSDGNSVNPTITLGGTLGGVQNSQLDNDNITIGSTSVDLGATATVLAGLTTVSATSFSGSFNGDFTGTTNLPDLTSGNGLTGGPYDGAAVATFAVEADGSTLSVGASGVKVRDAGITATQIATSVAGAGLSGGAGTALSVNVDDTSIEISTDTLNVKPLGISNAMLAGSIVNAKLVNDSVTLGTTEVNLGTTAATIAGLTLTGVVAAGTFTGDGSGLTGIASTLATAGTTGTGTVALKTQSLSVVGASGISTVASAQSVTISADVASDSVKGIASFAASDFSVSGGAVELAPDITVDQDLTVTRDMLVSRNAVVSGNLTVAGTASFQNTQNLDVADRFIRMASGSTAVGDGGIIVQQTGPTQGEAFAYDAATTRWSTTGSFDPSTEAYTPDSFMSLVVEGASGIDVPTAVVAKFVKKGNIFVGDNEDIYIYS